MAIQVGFCRIIKTYSNRKSIRIVRAFETTLRCAAKHSRRIPTFRSIFWEFVSSDIWNVLPLSPTHQSVTSSLQKDIKYKLEVNVGKLTEKTLQIAMGSCYMN